MKFAAVDIETSCGVTGCPGYGLSNSSQCEHAVHHKLNKIDIIGVYDGENYFCFRSVEVFDKWLDTFPGGLVGHGFKFDYKTLKAKGSRILPRQIVGDTQLLGSVVKNRVTDKYLAVYNKKRKELNELLPHKIKHRVGLPLSLKTMAPFYLEVQAFWETPESHDDERYNELDCTYTLGLHSHLLRLAEEDGTLEFYRKYLLPWNKLLTEMELEGVLIDEKRLHRMYQDAIIESGKLEREVKKFLTAAFKDWHERQALELQQESEFKCQLYCDERLKDKSKIQGVQERYQKNLKKKLDDLPKEFNLNSNDQMKFILDFYGVNTAVEKRDKETNEWIEKEGADKFVLKRAKVKQPGTPAELASRLLSFREKQTEVRYLKQYIEAVVEGRIYCTFNATGTRTGRLSSSGPNLQNVKGALREPFVIADSEHYDIYTVDASQIEPRVVAYLTGDPEMVSLFREGRDYHNYATKKFFPEETKEVAEEKIKESHSKLRKTAKIGDLSIIYGTGAFTFTTMCLLREEMDIPPDEGKKLVMSFREGMKDVFSWKKALEEAYKEGRAIKNIFGRLVQAREENLHMTLFNSLVQGTASDMILHAALASYREFCKRKIDAKPLLLVHDEIVFRFPKSRSEECKKIVDGFMTGYRLKTQHGIVPLACEGNLSNRWEK